MKSQAAVVLIVFVLVAVSARSQPSVGSQAPAAAPEVRPALPQESSPIPLERDAVAHAKAEADKRQMEAQALEQKSTQETQAHGYWSDPSSGLMWAAKDNGKDVNWHQATKYCRDLHLAGYSDWRLATIDELQGIYDDSRYASLPPRKGIEYILAGKAKGGLSLTGSYHWSASRVDRDHKNPGGNVWEFDFPGGKRHNDPPGYSGQIRALCVRGSGE